jgi:hypothetical protein
MPAHAACRHARSHHFRILTIEQPRYRDVVRHYLNDGAVSPLPFRRLAQAHPDRTDQVFARLLGRPSFTWSRDGEKLLRSTKAAYFAQPATPQFVPLSPRLAAAYRRRTDSSPTRPTTFQMVTSGQR